MCPFFFIDALGSRYHVATLIDQLKADDAALRIASMREVPLIGMRTSSIVQDVLRDSRCCALVYNFPSNCSSNAWA